ncbi:MAG TPA: MBL fold metallo-hydrolase [Actinomycetota bacterium]
MARTFEAAPGITAIDTRMFSRENATSAYLVAGREPALVETGSTLCVDEIEQGLEELGVGAGDLAHIVVTHIHLDHAGGAGAMASRFPSATVWVHERGAPHLADPTKLIASAERIYGVDGLRELFGAVEPVPEERIRALTDGDVISLGGDRTLTALYTPGHAGHHVCLADSATGGVFVGDAFGVFLPDVGVLRPATPPPEFDLEQAIASIRRVRERRPSRILFSHFGPSSAVEELCGLAVARLEHWTDVVRTALERTEDLDEIVSILREGTVGELIPDPSERSDVEERYELLTSYEMNALGITRYLRKQAERARREEPGG